MGPRRHPLPILPRVGSARPTGWRPFERSDIRASGPAVRQLTSDVVFFTHTAPPPTDEQLEELAAREIRVVSGPIESLEVEEDHLIGVRMQDGTLIPRVAVAVSPRFVARWEVLKSLGRRPSPHPN